MYQLVDQLDKNRGSDKDLILPKGVGLNVNFPSAVTRDCKREGNKWVLTRLLGNIDRDPVSLSRRSISTGALKNAFHRSVAFKSSTSDFPSLSLSPSLTQTCFPYPHRSISFRIHVYALKPMQKVVSYLWRGMLSIRTPIRVRVTDAPIQSASLNPPLGLRTHLLRIKGKSQRLWKVSWVVYEALVWWWIIWKAYFESSVFFSAYIPLVCYYFFPIKLTFSLC